MPIRTQGLDQQNAEGTEPAGRHRPRCPGPERCQQLPEREVPVPGRAGAAGPAGGHGRTRRGKPGHDPGGSGEGAAPTAAPRPARWYKGAERGRPAGLSPPRSARSGRSSTATARRHRAPSCPRTCRGRRGPGGPGGSGITPGGIGGRSRRSRPAALPPPAPPVPMETGAP